MPSAPRADAARNRARILDAARECDPASLRLNEVARRAGLGIGTVYRHFPTVHALLEALVESDLERYRSLARDASAERDPAAALEMLVRRGLALQLEDGGLQAVLLAPEDAAAEITALKRELWEASETIVTAARTAGVIRPDVTTARLQHLVCGAEHAARLSGDDLGFYVDTLLAGIRAQG